MDDVFPPNGYKQIKSKVSGITVYQATEDEGEHQEVVAFSCPQCGATSAFCSDNGGLTCTHCRYYEAPKEAVYSGKGSEEFEFTLATVQRASQGWGVDRKELVCSHCGGHSILPPESLSHTCPFCHSNKVVQQKAPQDVLRPRFLVPIKIHPNQIKAKVQEWMGNNWLLPKDLHRLAHQTEFVPVYIPYWTFDAQAKARWKAEVGKRVNVGKTTTTVWKWKSGWVEHYFDDHLENGSRHLDPHLLAKIQQFNLEELVPYDPSFLAGVSAQAYEVQLDDAWKLARQHMREEIKRRCRDQIHESKIRNFHMGLDFSEESWRYILLPFLIGSYTYNGKSYQVLINAQNRRLAGNRPADWNRLGKFALLSVIPAAFLLLGSLLFPEIKDELSIGSFLAFAGAAIFSIVSFISAKKLENP
ncbi:MAG: hypothetical protein AAF587_12210 [Bacteroidota bacterium]